MPNYSILHKQDIFITEKYEPDSRKDDLSFLSRSFERHFNERPYLHHTCYLFLTKTTRERSRQQSNWNTLCRGFLVPKEIRDKETAERFMEAVDSSKVSLMTAALSGWNGSPRKRLRERKTNRALSRDTSRSRLTELPCCRICN